MPTTDYTHLPGSEFIVPGIRDINEGKTTLESLLVSIAWGDLKEKGLPLKRNLVLDNFAEHHLYALLQKSEGNNAHSAYNALLRKLTSFQHALSQAPSAA